MTSAQTGFDTMRHAMVASQLRTTAVNDPRVVAAMATVPRERFVPDDSASMAYRDTAVPVGNGRYANVPMATGKLLTEAYLVATDRVLLIGAAGGYTAALLSGLVAHVVAVESDPALAGHARGALAAYANVTVVEGPLDVGHAADAPYDLLLVDGAVEHLPEALIAQVAIGGRVLTGLVDRGITRLAHGTRTAGGFALTPFADVDCVGLPGFAVPRGFTF